MDELQAIKNIHAQQRRWKSKIRIIFLVTIVVASIILIVLPRTFSAIFFQFVMLLSMASIFGMFFLNFISFQVNKRFFKKDVLHDYLFKHSKSDDIEKDPELIEELIRDRRLAAQLQKRL